MGGVAIVVVAVVARSRGSAQDHPGSAPGSAATEVPLRLKKAVKYDMIALEGSIEERQRRFPVCF